MKCPKCGETITNYETLDTEYYNGTYYDYLVGSCENCNKHYTWTEVFEYDHDEDIVELSECPIF